MMTMMKVMNLHCLISHHVDDDVGVVHRALLISPVGPFPTTEDPPRDKVDLGRSRDDRQQNRWTRVKVRMREKEL